MGRKTLRGLCAVALAALAAACAPTVDRQAALQVDSPVAQPAPPAARETVVSVQATATFYANRMVGRRTASGEVFRQDHLTAATNDFPLGSLVLVTNRKNGRSVEVVVNDRLARGKRHPVIDLSRSAADEIDMVAQGIVPVVVTAQPSRQRTPALAEAVQQLAADWGDRPQ